VELYLYNPATCFHGVDRDDFTFLPHLCHLHRSLNQAPEIQLYHQHTVVFTYAIYIHTVHREYLHFIWFSEYTLVIFLNNINWSLYWRLQVFIQGMKRIFVHYLGKPRRSEDFTHWNHDKIYLATSSSTLHTNICTLPTNDH
jgi:hypothetical protein